MPLKIAIVGRPNVGKSTLFNRLAGRKLAIVDDQPGVTRDRRFASGRLGDIDLELIDTAGFENVTDESLEARMRAQTSFRVQVWRGSQRSTMRRPLLARSSRSKGTPYRPSK